MKEKKKLGRPKLTLTDEQIHQAGKLAGIGCTVAQIAHVMDISVSSLERRISEDERLSEGLAKGRAQASAKVLNAAYKMAISEKNPFMTTFWLKCKLGWKEPKDDIATEDDAFTLNYARSKGDE